MSAGTEKVPLCLYRAKFWTPVIYRYWNPREVAGGKVADMEKGGWCVGELLALYSHH